MVDVVIIGAGVTGCAIARYLSRYQLNVLVLEKEEDVCCGTSKANSAIVHAGFDAAAGSKKAEYNVLGSRMFPKLAEELNFPFTRCGSLVLCLNKEEMPRLHALYENGLANGVEGLKLLTAEQLHELEPTASHKAVAALWAPTGAIVCPFGLTFALAENASENGVMFRFSEEVTDVQHNGELWRVFTSQSVYEAKTVVNAAGVYADVFHNMVSDRKIHITPKRGEYRLLDKTEGEGVKHTLFCLPDENGKGILVSPTVHGNIILGPTAEVCNSKEATNTTADGLDRIVVGADKLVGSISHNKVITCFAGLRAHEDGGEFLVGEVTDAPGFFDCAGIESPGLSSAPAIGLYLADIIAKKLSASKNISYKAERKAILNPKELSFSERTELIKESPAYGNIICRCETISEGEILDAIRRIPGARSLDGVKRRVRAGMGRCQGGFCSPRVMEILARELETGLGEVTKSGAGSDIVIQCVDKTPPRREIRTTGIISKAGHNNYDLVIIGAGPAGLAAAVSAYDSGCRSVIILERDDKAGGILNQCIHNGFGLHTFHEELTGPEYAARFLEMVEQRKIPIMNNTMVLSVAADRTVTAVNKEQGIITISARAVILAMGCRERPRGALGIPGYRPAGIFSAGTAQRLVNREGCLPGKRVVILGSGDIGLIMARRMTLEGANVLAVAELMPYSGGLRRNIVQCLEDYDIPLLLSHTVIDIEGKKRVKAVTLAQVDENRRPISGTEKRLECDTLLLSCGLIPENELSSGAGAAIHPITGGPIVNERLETTQLGIFAAGNVLHVHDLVDYVSEEATVAGAAAAAFIREKDGIEKNGIPVTFEGGPRYCVPHTVCPERVHGSLKLRFRVGSPAINQRVTLMLNGKSVISRRRPVMAPGEMEEITLTEEMLKKSFPLSCIHIKVEADN